MTLAVQRELSESVRLHELERKITGLAIERVGYGSSKED